MTGTILSIRGVGGIRKQDQEVISFFPRCPPLSPWILSPCRVGDIWRIFPKNSGRGSDPSREPSRLRISNALLKRISEGMTYLIHGYQRPVLFIPGKALHALSPSSHDVAIGRFVDADPRRGGGHLSSMGRREAHHRTAAAGMQHARDRVVIFGEVGPPRQRFGRVVVVDSVHS